MERAEMSMLLVKIESSYNTDPVPTQSANAIPVVRDSITVSEPVTHTQRRRAIGRLSKEIGFATNQIRTLTFRYELRSKSSISVSAPVEIDPLLRACDLAATYVSASTPSYRVTNLDTAVGDSCTIYFYSGGKLRKLTGTKGTFRVIIQPERPLVIEFTMTGFYSTPSATSIPSSPTYDATAVPLLASVTGLGVWADLELNAAINSAELTLGNQVAQRAHLGGSFGLKGFAIASRNPVARVEYETYPDFDAADFQRQNSYLGLSAAAGSGAGNVVTVAFNGSIMNVSQSNQQGIRTEVVDIDVCLDKPTSTGSALSPFTELSISWT